MRKMLSNKQLIFVSAVFLFINVTVLVVFVRFKSGEKCVITINIQSEQTALISDSFLSIGIDTSEIVNFNKINWSDPRLRELAAHLAPGRLRLGGTMSDRLIFSANDDINLSCEQCQRNNTNSVCASVRKMCKHKFLPFFIMTGTKWIEVNDFCLATNMTLLFTLNALLRNENGWNDNNAKDLLQYTKSKGYHVDFQLGNEPNSFKHVFNTTVNPKDLSHDFKRLRHLLNEYGFKQSLLVGPDTSSPRPHHLEGLHYMVDFLGNVSYTINARSWHQYYLNSRTAKLEDFWNYSTFELLNQQIGTLNNHTRKYKKIPVWLSETSSSYGGGAPGLSNSFAGTPLWLDKLGLCAKHNITTVIRQSLIGGNYSLIDKMLNPLPDWWVSVLYKKLVGNKVLNVNCKCSPNQRMYVHCTKNSYENSKKAITIFGINLEIKKVIFLLNGTGIEGENLDVDEYIFSTHSNDRLSKTVLLNGWPLHYETNLPEMKPVHLRYGHKISMPPYSVGFWVVKNTLMNVCH